MSVDWQPNPCLKVAPPAEGRFVRGNDRSPVRDPTEFQGCRLLDPGAFPADPICSTITGPIRQPWYAPRSEREQQPRQKLRDFMAEVRRKLEQKQQRKDEEQWGRGLAAGGVPRRSRRGIPTLEVVAMKTLARWCTSALLALALGSSVWTWAQPAPGDEVVLPAPVTAGRVSLEAAIASRRSVKEFADTPLTWEEIGQLAWAAQGITEPDKGLRAAPSAAAMYPLHIYLATPDGLYHYVPFGHKLEKLPLVDALTVFRGVTSNQPSVQQAPLTVIITAEFGPMRERFGERAEGFVYMEAGHVGQNLQLQARALGLASLPVGGFDAARVAEALALPAEHTVIYLMPIGHQRPAVQAP